MASTQMTDKTTEKHDALSGTYKTQITKQDKELTLDHTLTAQQEPSPIIMLLKKAMQHTEKRRQL